MQTNTHQKPDCRQVIKSFDYREDPTPGGEFFMTQNEGERLVESNYWGSESEKKGFYYMTANAGAIRLLVPSDQETDIPDILTGKHAVITKGYSRPLGRIMHEIMFEDHTHHPFGLWISESQWERTISIEEAASRDRTLIVYKNGCVEVVRMPVFFREGYMLPYLKPWHRDAA